MTPPPYPDLQKSVCLSGTTSFINVSLDEVKYIGLFGSAVLLQAVFIHKIR